jgi:ribosome-binding protein aMBF1 (putative translation factor)
MHKSEMQTSRVSRTSRRFGARTLGEEGEQTMTIGQEIKRLRTERGWTTKVLSARSRIHCDTIRKIETGHDNCTLFVLTGIATAFGLRTSELVRLAEENL